MSQDNNFIKIKDTNVLISLLYTRFNPKLFRVLRWWKRNFGKLVITEGFRPKKHVNDLHGVYPVRAVDLRSWIYEDPEEVARICNRTWTYDPSRPRFKVCVYHNAGSGAHFHVQVHPMTENRGE